LYTTTYPAVAAGDLALKRCLDQHSRSYPEISRSLQASEKVFHEGIPDRFQLPDAEMEVKDMPCLPWRKFPGSLKHQMSIVLFRAIKADSTK
jgi:hypothetical protein